VIFSALNEQGKQLFSMIRHAVEISKFPFTSSHILKHNKSAPGKTHNQTGTPKSS